eukprot:gene9971-11807_t
MATMDSESDDSSSDEDVPELEDDSSSSSSKDEDDLLLLAAELETPDIPYLTCTCSVRSRDTATHDSFMLRESKLPEELEEYFGDDEIVYMIYGDPAYPISRYLIVGFKGVNLMPDKKALNKFMSSVREAVEWSFGKVLQYYAYLDFKKNMKLLLQPVSQYYKAGVLLSNMHTCLYGSTSSRYFDCDPPTLEEYLAMAM